MAPLQQQQQHDAGEQEQPLPRTPAGGGGQQPCHHQAHRLSELLLHEGDDDESEELLHAFDEGGDGEPFASVERIVPCAAYLERALRGARTSQQLPAVPCAPRGSMGGGGGAPATTPPPACMHARAADCHARCGLQTSACARGGCRLEMRRHRSTRCTSCSAATTI